MMLPLVAEAAGLGRLRLGDVLGVLLRAVDVLLEDGVRLVDLPLCLELPDVVGDAAAVGPAARLVEVEVLVKHLVAHVAPVIWKSVNSIH